MDAPNDVQQVVETTPGQSQKLFKTPETVNLTEKIQGTQQGLSGFPVSFASEVDKRNC